MRLNKIVLFGFAFIVSILTSLNILALNSPKSTLVSQSLSLYGPTRDHESLWKIAMILHPKTTSVQQVMLALMENNKEAFICQNVHSLKSGYFLHLPSLKTIKKIPVDMALSKVMRQNAAWRDNPKTFLKICIPFKHVINKKSKNISTVSTIETQTSTALATVSKNNIDDLEGKLTLVNQDLQSFKQLSSGEILVLQARNNFLQQQLFLVSQQLQSVDVKIAQLTKTQKLMQQNSLNYFFNFITRYLHKVFLYYNGFIAIGVLGLCILLLIFLKVYKCKQSSNCNGHKTGGESNSCSKDDNQKNQFPQITESNNFVETELAPKAQSKSNLQDTGIKRTRGTERNAGSNKEITLEGYDLSSKEELAAKLDLARVYIDMDDKQKALAILEDVLNKGDAEQKKDALMLSKKAKINKKS